ncbi:MAG TPA: condensation domain-containing protein, partial [Myxococcaceae bacterium]|nr:condensation domain-containing protein [Myxococcaceae bacterium]
SLPMTPNGKVDRQRLPAPERAGVEERCTGLRTPVEEVLAGTWAEVLGLERVSVTESFFELGGHSMLAIRVVARIRDALGVELPLRLLFEAPTVAGLAERVEALRGAERPPLPPVVPVERTPTLALSFAQERLWFLHQLQPESDFYNFPAALRLSGVLEVRPLERALAEIVRRHEALRTRFPEVRGAPVQVILPFAGFALPVEDLSRFAPDAREPQMARRLRQEAARPFDLAAGPLLRARLLRLGSEEHVLLLCMHHIVSDGWSMDLLWRELWVLYGAYVQGEESPLPELAVQYADYAAWQREQLRGEALEGRLGYWRQRLAGAPALLELPTDRARPAVQTHRGAQERLEVGVEVVERLRALGRREGATLYMVLLGAFQVLLSKYSGSEDIVVGSPVAGRTRKEVEELIGFFVNTLVLRTDVGGDPSFREVLGRVREGTLEAYEHQEVPFERVVEALRPERTPSHSPLFQVMFALQNGDAGGDGLPGLDVAWIDAEPDTAKFDLSLGLTATSRGLQGGIDFSRDLFEASTIRRMLGHLERVLEQVAMNSDVPLSGLELMGEAERACVLEAWNPAAVEGPWRCVHELFQEQAARTPEAVALVNADGTVTFAELDRSSSRLSRRLRAHGVAPEAVVAVLMEHSPLLVEALLAILKAGGVYLPLDPDIPTERLEHMLRDSGAVLVLTQPGLEGRVPSGGPGVVTHHLSRTHPAGEEQVPPLLPPP